MNEKDDGVYGGSNIKQGHCQSFVKSGDMPISQMICKLNDIKGHLEDFRRCCPNATDFQQRMFIAGYMKIHNISFRFE